MKIKLYITIVFLSIALISSGQTLFDPYNNVDSNCSFEPMIWNSIETSIGFIAYSFSFSKKSNCNILNAIDEDELLITQSNFIEIPTLELKTRQKSFGLFLNF